MQEALIKSGQMQDGLENYSIGGYASSPSHHPDEGNGSDEEYTPGKKSRQSSQIDDEEESEKEDGTDKQGGVSEQGNESSEKPDDDIV